MLLTRQIAHLDLDGFLIAVERTADPSLCDRPLVIGGRPGARGIVAVASVEAQARGVRTGCPIRVAAERCPDAVFLEGSFDRYLDAAAALDDTVRQRCARVEWVSLDEAYLDLTDPRRAAAYARRLVEDLQEDIRSSFHFDVATGLATNKVVARVASRLARPRGLLYVLPGYEPRFLAPLGIALLPGLDAEAVVRLHEAGMTTLGDLAAVPTDRAVALLGRGAARLIRHAAGQDDAPVVVAGVPRGLRATITVPDSAAAGAGPVSAFEVATNRVTELLERQPALARGVAVTVRSAGGGLCTRSASLRRASADRAVILSAARRLFLRSLRPQTVPISVTVSLSGLVPAAPQLSLFGPRTLPADGMLFRRSS